MKIGVITDIHSNLPALKAVLSEMDNIKPDYIICCGDVVGNGAFPEETVQILSRLKNFYCVKGNHDIFATINLDGFSQEDPRLKLFRWQQKVLSGYSKKYLAGLPLKFSGEYCGMSLAAAHYPMNEKNRFKDLIYLPNDEQTKELFKDYSEDIILFGHEHTGSLQKIGNQYFLNFGTLGNFLEEGMTRFGILYFENGNFDYELKKVPYDEGKAKKSLETILKILYNR